MLPATYRIHPTPLGEALLVSTTDGLVHVQLLDAPLAHALAPVALALRAAPVPDDAVTDAEEWLDAYFEGERGPCPAALDWRLAHGFTRRALDAIRDIPYGETATYGEIAAAAGSRRAHRAVGTACATTPFSLVIPVHRVVRADGNIGEYGGRPDIKRALLELEGALPSR
ncbi:methylated-DNA--[protein]-cysteine S-methyltransferase [Microbacterium sp. X-17]|uniref:methylated-DNA--[protein]-cysteine S-methyltransferase n=1 Tax=Microbacterium sp. X-17 TaxID=3144404 RepID=UPI0031F47D0B